MDLPAGFAGRRQQVLELVDSLQSVGACPVIYGDSGLGKSSLASQIARIALGDVDLLHIYGVPERALEEDQQFVPFWIPCSDATQTKSDLLQRMINQAIGHTTLDSFDKRNVASVNSKEKINLRFYENETVKNYANIGHRDYYKLDIEDQLLAVLETLRENGITRALFIIDELDRVNNTAGLASFIKNTSGEDIKFLLVGVAQNVTTLLADHTSLERQLYPIRVTRMVADELSEIITKALELLRGNGAFISVTPEAEARLVSAANGFPWFVHVLAREALVSVWDDGRDQIEEIDVVAAIDSLSQNRFAQQFQDLYQSAVKESCQREILLRLMAKWDHQDIPLSDIYAMAKRLSISNPSTYKKHLTSYKHGSILVTPPRTMREIVRFRNTMFKQYINLRQPIFSDAKTRVEGIWKNS